MFYRDFEGKYEFDPDAEMYIGELEYQDTSKEIIHFVPFRGKTPEELEDCFKSEVDKYIKFLNT